MLELVFVIVVVGILAAAIIPRMDRDTVYEASEQLLNHIKYTQQLAMSDNVYDDSDSAWYEERWRLTLSDANDQYAISQGKVSDAVYATDPLAKNEINGMAGGNDYDLNDKYSVTISIASATAGGATGTFDKLVFDHLGRPYAFSGNDQTSAVSNLLETDYNITVTEGSDSAIITVTSETGYSYITY